jgi:hypothetical protein
MRAILVELAGPDDAAVRGIIEGRARLPGPGEVRVVARGEGALAPVERSAQELASRTNLEGEPL